MNFFKKIFNNIITFAKKYPLEFWILVGILAVGAFCRLYKIGGYMTFLGDEGRDVIIVRRLLTQGHPPLIGPGTSIGNMYLGPFYYYMMAPALFLANFSPIGPAIQIAVLGIITIWILWFVFREWFPTEKNNFGALIAAGFYAISPTVIIYSRSSWNPNIMPFFALISIYSIWKVWKDKKYNWLLVLGFSLAAVVQSHYLGLLLLPTLFIFWILTYWNLGQGGRWKFETGEFIKKSIYGVIIFILLMSPLFFFDLRHNWINVRAMYQFFTIRQTTVSIKPWTAIPSLYPQFISIMERLVGGQNVLAGEITGIASLIGLIIVLFINRKKLFKINPAYYLVTSWVFFGVLGLCLYKQHIYDHYFGFLFATPYILIGIVSQLVLGVKNKIFYAVLILALGFLVFVNLTNSPLRYPPNNQMQRAYDVAKKIEKVDNDQRFNLGVIAVQNYEDGYKYFLLKDNAPVVDIDPQVKSSITNQLFAACELDKNKCDPTHNASAAVADFGWSKIDGSWEVDGVILYRLVHSRQ